MARDNAIALGVDIVYWKEVESGQPDEHWVYATGWVTEVDGNGAVVGTRFATFKYDAAFFDAGNPPPREAEAFFPPLGTPISSGDSYKAVAMALDESTGDIYVTGEGPDEPGGTDQDYVVIRYDKDLVAQWGGTPRFYNGPISGDDIPADIGLDPHVEVVVVTGASPGDGTGLDIATVAFNADDGSRVSDAWPPDGVRRYNNGAEDGDDRGVELGGIGLVVDGIERFLEAIVLGTSWGGATFDDYITHKWGGSSGTLEWARRYDNGGNDVARGLVVPNAWVYVTGYSEDGPGGLAEPDIDFATISYGAGDGADRWDHRWDYVGDPDFPADIQVRNPPLSDDVYVWVTGAAHDGSFVDIATLQYKDAPGLVTLEWTDAWSGSATAWQFPRGLTLHGADPYIVGAMGDSSNDAMVVLTYDVGSSSVDFRWSRGFNSGGFDEGRAVAIADVDPGGGQDNSVYVVGVTTVSGEGRQFTVWRYREED